MEVHNKTGYDLEEVKKMPLLGRTKNNWRRRNVYLHQHPTDPDSVISVGYGFDGNYICVVAEKKHPLWSVALDYAARGQVYESH